MNFYLDSVRAYMEQFPLFCGIEIDEVKELVYSGKVTNIEFDEIAYTMLCVCIAKGL